MNVAERQRMIDQYRDGIAEVDKALAGATEEELDRVPARTSGQPVKWLTTSPTPRRCRPSGCDG